MENGFKIEVLKDGQWDTLDLRGKPAEFARRDDAEFVFKKCGFDRHTDRARINAI